MFYTNFIGLYLSDLTLSFTVSHASRANHSWASWQTRIIWFPSLTCDALVLNYLGVSGGMDRKRDFSNSKFVFFLYKNFSHKRNKNIHGYCKGSNNFCPFDLQFKPTLKACIFVFPLLVIFSNITLS